MLGPSTVRPSQARSRPSMAWASPSNDVKSSASLRLHKRGLPPLLPVSPSLFQRRYAEPSDATKALGSIEPCWPPWHTSGPELVSTKSLYELFDVATEMHWMPARVL